MKDYSTMDDGAINMLVGESLGLTSYYLNHDRSVQFRNEKGHIKGTKNYCNNPADAWPIILNNGINIFTDMIPHGLLGQARVSVISGGRIGAECLIAKHINPLRAAMEVYLMKKDAEKCHG